MWKHNTLLISLRQGWQKLLSPCTRAFLLIAGLNFLWFALLRIAFVISFNEKSAAQYSYADFWHSFQLGLRFDLRLGLLIILPLVIFSVIPWLNPRYRFMRVVWWLWLTLAIFLCQLVYVIDFGNFAYQETRFNASLLEFLQAAQLSTRMVWETYPVLAILLFVLGGMAFYSWLIWRMVLPIFLKQEPSCSIKQRWQRYILSVLAVIGLLVGIYGNNSAYPLRWSQAYFTNNVYLNALALNPVLFFFDTYEDRVQSFDANATQKYYPVISKYLNIPPQQPPLSYQRFIKPSSPLMPKNTNVVIIMMESLSSYFVGSLGNPAQPTPNLDSLLPRSWTFTNFYTPTAGTARSVFTALVGIPDVDASNTSSRNPLIVDQHILLNEWPSEYKRFYFIGGSANWGNLRGTLQSNIKNLQLMEEGSYDAPVVDVWGISDLDLFKSANRVFKETQQPFFAFIVTSGSHRPYTIPKNRLNFQPKEIPHEEVKAAGFQSLAEYNSFRLLDFSLGHFFQLAEKEHYFPNTLFVILGDHGLPSSGKHIPPGYTQLGITSFHVPLVFYNPHLIKNPRKIETIASEVDLLPTITSLLGFSYRYRGLGQNLFSPNIDHNRPIFTIRPNLSAPQIGLLEKRFYFQRSFDGQDHMYQYRSKTYLKDIKEQYPEKFQSMKTLAMGLFETSRYLLYNNPSITPSLLQQTE